MAEIIVEHFLQKTAAKRGHNIGANPVSMLVVVSGTVIDKDSPC